MNGLTLRITNDRKIKPIKKDVKKEDISSILSPLYSSHIKVFDDVLSAVSIEEQVQSFRTVFSSILNEELDYADILIVIDILVHILLSIKPKSHLSPPLLKFLSGLPIKYHSSLEECLTSQLTRRLERRDLPIELVQEYAVALQLCLENRNSLHFSLQSCLGHVLDFLRDSLSQVYSLFQKENAPIKKLALINGIHSCIQVGISSLQQEAVAGEGELCRIVVEILSERELPIDTRATAGILAAHLSTNIHHQHWKKIFNHLSGSNNYLGMLCFCSGLLNVLTVEQLQERVQFYSEPEATVKIIYITVTSIEEKNASESGIVLAATRSIVLFTRTLVNIPDAIIKEIIDSLLTYLWVHIEHYMDAVRHLALSALNNLQAIARVHPELGIFERVQKAVEDMPIDRRGKHAAISLLVSHVPVDSIISRSSGLVEALLAAALANPSSNYAISTLEQLMREDLKEVSASEKWFCRWVEPLLHTQLSAPLEQLLTTLLKIHPPILQQIVSLGLSESKGIKIEVILTCLKIGRKLNILKGTDVNNKWKGLIDYKILDSCMYNFQDEVRLACFALLVETSKSTEEFTTSELKLIQTFFKYNFTNQEPAFRQKSLAFSKKFLTRMRDSRGALIRRQHKVARSDVSSENISLILDEYGKTIDELRASCLDSLFPGASPPRRSFAFGILALFKELGFWTQFDLKTAQTLLPCLLDSYEENKQIAKDLLASMPQELLKLQDEEHVNRYIKLTLELCSSIRPPDSISAAYFMSLVASYHLPMSNPNIKCSSRYYCLSAALDSLMCELSVAKESLLQAACSGPLYGHLFLIRHLLQHVNLNEVGDCEDWQKLVQKIIKVAFECNAVVAHVVYNSSPEGHLPMDFTYSYIRKESDPQVTSQMVLLCSWRTVKEVSLLLGELVERATISGDDSVVGLVSEAQILEIGEHLTGLLSETKHRGAFEQAYLGFSKLAARLWRCRSRGLHELPKRWLDETLHCISSNESLSATRRSAGIPFIVQALICSELDSGSCKSLHHAMGFLLDTASNSSSEGRVHALNILRALYRGSTLGEAVGPYVADGIATAINGFNSNTWAERNSSTLLLSALMSRVFGVPRGKSENLSWRNKMTGRLFFQRYPSLYGELLSHLEASSSNQMYPALYPVLLLLGRLYPSSLEGTDSNLQLMKYLPYVMDCSESSILKTRSLAATAVSSLIPAVLYVEYLNQFISSLSQAKKENHRHGLLLMVLKLIQQITTIENIQMEKINSHISSWMETFTAILNSSSVSFISKDTCIQVIIYIFLDLFEELSPCDIGMTEDIVEKIMCNETSSDCSEYGREVFYSHSALLLFLMNIRNQDSAAFIKNIVSLLRSTIYEVVGITLEVLIYVLSQKETTFHSNINENLKMNLINPYVINELRICVKSCSELKEILLSKVVKGVDHHEDMVKVVECVKLLHGGIESLPSPVKFIHNMCKRSSHSVASQALQLLATLPLTQANCELGDEEMIDICDMIDEYSNAEADDSCREAIADLLSNNFHRLLLQATPIHKLEIWICGVRLILDEVAEIREKMCKGLTGDVVASRGVELLIHELSTTSDLQSAVVGLLYLSVGTESLSQPSDLDDGSLFDKGAANSFYEELAVCRIACNELVQLAQANSLSQLLFDRAHSDWLKSNTDFTAASIGQFIRVFQDSISTTRNLTDLLPCRPHENQLLLQTYKLENLLKVNSFL